MENNNKQSIINSKLFKEIESLSEDFKKDFIDNGQSHTRDLNPD